MRNAAEVVKKFVKQFFFFYGRNYEYLLYAGVENQSEVSFVNVSVKKTFLLKIKTIKANFWFWECMQMIEHFECI
jgi:hypothetical protein